MKLDKFPNVPELEELAKNTIGDGQEPNHFIITISDNIIDEKGDEKHEYKPTNHTIAKFNSLSEAQEFIDDEIELSHSMEQGEIHECTIEDRLNGTVMSYMMEYELKPTLTLKKYIY